MLIFSKIKKTCKLNVQKLQTSLYVNKDKFDNLDQSNVSWVLLLIDIANVKMKGLLKLLFY